MSDTDKILAAIHAVNLNVDAVRGEVGVIRDRVAVLEGRADAHDKALEHGVVRDKANSDADLKHASDLASTIVAFNTMSRELNGVKGRLSSVEASVACAAGDVAKRVEATTAKAAGEAVAKAKPNPYLHAAALFVGTSGGIFLATFLGHLLK